MPFVEGLSFLPGKNAGRHLFRKPHTCLQARHICVVCSEECPAIIWISLKDPPTNEIFLDVSVMKVRRPLCDEPPIRPKVRYHFWNMLMIVWDVVKGDLSVRTTNEPFILKARYFLCVSNNSIRFSRTLLWSGITLPLLPFEVWLVRLICVSTSPSELQTSFHDNCDISFALKPLLTDNKKWSDFSNHFCRFVGD